MAGSTLKGEPVPCQGGGCTHFPREGVRARVNMREGSVVGRPGPYRAWITDTSAPPGRNAHSPCGRREREKKEEGGGGGGGGGNKQTLRREVKGGKKRASKGKVSE